MKLFDNDKYRDDFMELVYRLLHSDGTNDRANQIIDAFDSIPVVEAMPVLPNSPLTMDELREMDGEPVWVCLPNGSYGGWMINYQGWCMNRFASTEMYGTYGKSWLAYRRRPEEGMT